VTLGWPLSKEQPPVRPNRLGWPHVSRETAEVGTPVENAPDDQRAGRPQSEINQSEINQSEINWPEISESEINYPEIVRRETAVPQTAQSDPETARHVWSGKHRDGIAGTAIDAAGKVRTAADLDQPGPVATSEAHTPLAQAAQHRVAVATGRPLPSRLSRPATTRVLVVANQKGGVGKTTSAVNIAAALAQHGLRILVLDLDPQGNASTALGIEHSEGTSGIYEVMTGDLSLEAVITPSADISGLYGVPATIDLAGAELDLFSMVSREHRLRRALEQLMTERVDGDNFDYIFIDCPPSLGLLTVNAMTAAHEVLIPIQCEYYALEGLTQLLRTIDQIREFLNPALRIGSILLTMYDARTRLAAGVADEVREHFPDLVLGTTIPRSVRISEAPSYGQTVLTYDPGSPGALCYLEAAKELADKTEEVAR
jgi:chromosome partitioning protein